jgi:hypothetical protein
MLRTFSLALRTGTLFGSLRNKFGVHKAAEKDAVAGRPQPSAAKAEPVFNPLRTA